MSLLAHYAQLKQGLWFLLQTAVLQNLLGYLALDSLRRALLIKVSCSNTVGEVPDGKTLCSVCACVCGVQFWYLSETLLFLSVSMRETLPQVNCDLQIKDLCTAEMLVFHN